MDYLLCKMLVRPKLTEDYRMYIDHLPEAKRGYKE